MNTHTRRQRLVLVGLLLALLAAEVVVRLSLKDGERAAFTPIPESIRRESTYPGVPFLLAPHAETVHAFGSDPRGSFDPGAKLTYRTNAHGFRGPETTLAKPAATTRILGLGDSFTFGTGVRQRDTFLAVLQRRLDDTPAQRIEVLNLGIMSFDTKAECHLLRTIGVDFDPDVVVITFFLNDAGGGGAPAPLIDASEKPWWRRHFRTLDVLASARERRGAANDVLSSYRASLQPSAPGWLEAREALRKTRAMAERRGFQLVLAIFPVLWELSDYPLKDVHATVTDFGREIDVAVLDLLPAFAGHDGPELWVHPSNRHPNEIAHAIVGEALHRFLVDEGLLGD